MKEITAADIIQRLSQFEKGAAIPSDQGKLAAVLIPLFCDSGDWKILFTRRSQFVQDHKGQVSFPGGAHECLDQNLEATALRETYEEIGVRPEKIWILGRMDPFPTISNYLITPVVGLLTFPFEIKPAVMEVERVFSVRLDWLADERNIEERDYARPNGSVEKVLFYQEVDGEMIWGITARILTRFLQIITCE